MTARVATQRRFEAGSTIFAEGGVGRRLLILREGQVGVYRRGLRLATVTEEGEMIGELAFLTQSPRQALVKAETDCVLDEVTDVEAFFRERPERAVAVAQTLARRLRDMNERFLHIREELDRRTGTTGPPESELPEDLEFVRRYLRGWRLHV